MIEFKDRATDGKVNIPRGKYLAAMNGTMGEVVLTGGGKDFKLQATKRRSTVNNKNQKGTAMTFYSSGGQQWSLLITNPKSGEWIVMFELGKDAVVKGADHTEKPKE